MSFHVLLHSTALESGVVVAELATVTGGVLLSTAMTTITICLRFGEENFEVYIYIILHI